MVFFICNHCGESVKKPAVEKHYNTKCRGNSKSVSCMDCLKDFYNQEYVAHTKCISEIQKYSGKDYVHKEPKNSGAKKQEGWMDIIRAILDSSDYKLSGQARSAFEQLQGVDNVPRKKVKFQNFVKNCMHMPVRLAEEVWLVLEKEQEKMKLSKQQDKTVPNSKPIENGKQNGTKIESTKDNGHYEPAKKRSKKEKISENGNLSQIEQSTEEGIEIISKKLKKKKRKSENDAATESETNGVNDTTERKLKKHKAEKEEIVVDDLPDTTLDANTENDRNSFEWSAVLEKIVHKNKDGITLEKLKKRVLKKYSAMLGGEELTEKQQKKFEKKFGKNFKKSTALQVEGDIVKARSI